MFTPSRTKAPTAGAGSSNYCSYNLHCNLCVASNMCCHPSWIKHQLSSQEHCAIGAQRERCWWNCLGGKTAFTRLLCTEREENGNSLSRTTQGHSFLAEGFLFHWEEENNSRGEALSQRWTWGQLILSTSCGDKRSRARQLCRWSVIFCLHLLHKCYLA